VVAVSLEFGNRDQKSATRELLVSML